MKISTIKFEGKNLEVSATKDYGIFKFIKENRNSEELSTGLNGHARKIMESLTLLYMFTLIVVNEKMEIIDGQNRVAAMRELGLTIYYIIIPGYNGTELQRFNQYSKNWSLKDYLNYYCEGGNKHYLTMRELVEQFPNVSITTFIILLGSDDIRKDKGFQRGFFKITIKDLNLFHSQLLLASDLSGLLFNNSINHEFLVAAVGITNHPKYKHQAMMNAIEKTNGSFLKRSTNISSYRYAFSETWNFGRTEKYQINFHSSRDLELMAKQGKVKIRK